MRLIHTSDIHLDHSFVSEGFPPHLGTRRRQSLRHVLQAILDRARDWPADAVLIAGDLFERDYITRETIAFLHEAFARVAPIPIVIAPGNHDPFEPESPYALESWPSHVHVFRKPRWASVPLFDRLVVHGFAFDGAEISHNPFGELRVPDDGRIHVAVAHASEINHLPASQKLYCPFRIEDALPAGLRYLALGHYHDFMAVSSEPGAAAAYAGAPESLAFRDRAAGHYIEIDISPDDLVVTPVRVGRSRFAAVTVDCSGTSVPEALLDQILQAAAGDDRHVALRVTLTGSCAPAIWAESDRLHEALTARFEHVEWLDRTEPMEDFEALSRENTSLGSFASTVIDEIRTTPEGARHQMLVRARDVGLAAFRGWELPVRGLGRE